MHVSCSRGNTLFRFFAKFCTVKISQFFIAPICPITDYVYTEHKNKTISLHCSSGSLQTLDCLLNWNKTGKFSFSANSISQDFLRFNDSNATWSKTKFQVIKSEGLYIFNEVSWTSSIFSPLFSVEL